jgi:hypothetical protein
MLALQAGYAAETLLNETFEGPWTNNAPAGWTAEYVNGSVDWQQATGGHSGNPAAAHSGSYNALMYNASWTPYQTRLITPVIDLDPQAYTNAYLNFWLAQKDWWGDQDRSYVYYRQSSGDCWTLIPGGSFTYSIGDWTHFELELPNLSDTYQIAFVGETRFGYGVCIDDVTVIGNRVGLRPQNPILTIPQVARGSISPSNPQVPIGQDQTFQITPDTYYRTRDVIIDGESAGPMSTYTFENVMDSHVIAALFNRVFTPNDFNGNEAAGLGLYYPTGGQWFINDGTASRIEQFGWEASIPVAADFDGDGKTDVAIYWPAGGQWFIKQSMNGIIRSEMWGWGDALPVPADYNGDGKVDIAVYWPEEGKWYIQSPDGKSIILDLGSADEIPVPADYDGDGKADPAVYHMSTGVWRIDQSSKIVPMQYTFGGRGAIPVPADYDNDGKAEIVVYTPTAGSWSFYPGIAPGPDSYNWGWDAAFPVPADYDGDGKADMAVYAPDTGTWYLRQSTSGIGIINYGWSAACPCTPAYQILKWFNQVP